MCSAGSSSSQTLVPVPGRWCLPSRRRASAGLLFEGEEGCGGVPETFSLNFPSSIICTVTMHVGDSPVFLLIITSATPQPLPPLATRVKKQLGEGVDDWLVGTWLESAQAVNLVCPTRGIS